MAAEHEATQEMVEERIQSSQSSTVPYDDNRLKEMMRDCMKEYQQEMVTEFRKAVTALKPPSRDENYLPPSRSAGDSSDDENLPRGNPGDVDDHISLYPQSTIGEKSETSKRRHAERYKRTRNEDLASIVEGSSKRSKLGDEQLLDVEEEIFQEVDAEKKRLEDEEKGGKVSSSLASRIPKYWAVYSEEYNTRKAIYEAYKLPENCEDLTIPLLNKEVAKMNNFTQYNRRIDNDLKDIQYLLNKSMQVLIDIADTAIKADKASVVLKTKDVVTKVLDATVVLGHANSKINNKRRGALRKLFAADTQAICDKGVENSKLLFGDEFAKNIKEAKEESLIAKTITPKQQTPNNPPHYSSSTISQNPNRKYLAKKGNQPYRSQQQQQKPFLGQGKHPNQPPWKNNHKFQKPTKRY